jgi:sensor domain CHASE-containing protein
MKIKENFVLRQVADTWVVLPLGAATLNFDGMLTLNQSGVLLWQALEKGGTEAELTEVLLGEYDVSREEAAADVRQFLDTLMQSGCLDA